MTKPQISIITPTFNRWDLLEKCGEALFKRARGQFLEWIIIDNGTDGSGRRVAAKFGGTSDIEVLHGDNRWSFARQNNHAANLAGGKYLLFLNNDVELISPLALVPGLLEADPVGALGGILLFPDRTLQHAGVIMQENAAPANLGRRAISKLGLDPDKIDPAGWPCDAIPMAAVTGALLAVKKEHFEEIGGFDESFPWGFEDVDFCLRLLDRLGRGSFVSRHLAGIHAESSSGRRADIDLGLLVFRGRWGCRVFADYQRFQRQPGENPKDLVRVLEPKDAQETGHSGAPSSAIERMTSATTAAT